MTDNESDTAVDVWTMGSLDLPKDEAAPTDPLSIWAKIGLTGLFLALLTPLVGLAGTWISALLGQLAAVGVETSGAKMPVLEPDIEWDLRLVYLLALAVLGLRAAVSALPRPTWKVAGLGAWPLWLVLGAALWLTTAASLSFEQHVLDVADGTHTVVLGATALWTAATALWLVASLGHATMVGLRIAARRSRIASGAVAVTGIASMAVVTPVLANPEVIGGDDLHRDAPMLGAVLEDVREAERMLAGVTEPEPSRPRSGIPLMGSRPAASADAGPTTPALPPSSVGSAPSGDVGLTPPPLPPQTSSTNDASALSASCMEALVDSDTGEEQSIRATVTRDLRARYPSVQHEVEELVRWKMIDVCSDGREREPDQLKAYLYTLARNATVSRIRKLGAQARAWSRNRCLIDDVDDPIEAFEEHQHREFTAARLLFDLHPSKRSLIQDRYFDGMTFAEMADRRDTTYGAVARATNRAVRDLRTMANVACDQKESRGPEN